jgi:HSP20 family protein
MQRYTIRNRAFDRMGERYAPIIDHDHFLGRSAFDVPHQYSKIKKPPVNIIKKDKLYEMQLFIPGFQKEEINISVKDDLLVIEGKTEGKMSEDLDKQIIVEEFNLESFRRTFRIDPAIAREEIKASYKNGILKLTFLDVPLELESANKTVKVK